MVAWLVVVDPDRRPEHRDPESGAGAIEAGCHAHRRRARARVRRVDHLCTRRAVATRPAVVPTSGRATLHGRVVHAPVLRDRRRAAGGRWGGLSAGPTGVTVGRP